MAPVDVVEVTMISGKVSTSSSKRAYVTFLAGNGDYVKGVVGLAKGLRKVKSDCPFVVAVLPNVPEEHQGGIVHEIEPIYPPENQIQFAAMLSTTPSFASGIKQEIMENVEARHSRLKNVCYWSFFSSEEVSFENL